MEKFLPFTHGLHTIDLDGMMDRMTDRYLDPDNKSTDELITDELIADELITDELMTDELITDELMTDLNICLRLVGSDQNAMGRLVDRMIGAYNTMDQNTYTAKTLHNFIAIQSINLGISRIIQSDDKLTDAKQLRNLYIKTADSRFLDTDYLDEVCNSIESFD